MIGKRSVVCAAVLLAGCFDRGSYIESFPQEPVKMTTDCPGIYFNGGFVINAFDDGFVKELEGFVGESLEIVGVVSEFEGRKQVEVLRISLLAAAK